MGRPHSLWVGELMPMNMYCRVICPGLMVLGVRAWNVMTYDTWVMTLWQPQGATCCHMRQSPALQKSLKAARILHATASVYHPHAAAINVSQVKVSPGHPLITLDASGERNKFHLIPPTSNTPHPHPRCHPHVKSPHSHAPYFAPHAATRRHTRKRDTYRTPRAYTHLSMPPQPRTKTAPQKKPPSGKSQARSAASCAD